MRLLSPRELADALGVSESSLKRWVDAGKIAAARTEGGHRKISLPEAVRFIRETGAPVAHPELLDMPEVAAVQRRAIGRDALFEMLAAGDAPGVRGWLLARYLDGTSIAELCDGPIRDAMHQIGELWRHDREGVFVEHRATDICLQALAHLRNTLDVPADAPLALGATPENDPYILPSLMAAIVVGEAGMRAVNLGPDTPASALQHASPAISRSWCGSARARRPARARTRAPRWLTALPPSTIGVVGGRQSEAIASAQPGVRRIATMAELAAIASGIVRR